MLDYIVRCGTSWVNYKKKNEIFSYSYNSELSGAHSPQVDVVELNDIWIRNLILLY